MRQPRRISDQFMKDLKEEEGVFLPLLNRIKQDDTLMLALRGSYINIYYRGGSLFKISARGSDSRAHYCVEFDTDYNRGYQSLALDFPREVSDSNDVSRLVDEIAMLKYVMDRYFSANNKPEREFQQLVVRENNFSSISTESEYFIVDIELADDEQNAKFDMLAVRWLSNERNTPSMLVPALIEIKYGIKALEGDSGLIKHLEDAYKLRKDEKSWSTLLSGLQDHLKQIKDLGLLKFNRSDAVPQLLLHPERTPELIFLLANYNPRSRIGLDILRKLNAVLYKIDPQHSEQKLFDVRFFQASFAGYAMHHVSMLSPADFESVATKLHQGS